jgi:hypothetical protein
MKMNEEAKFKSLMSCLFSPIITWPSYRIDDIPKDLLDDVRLERMANMMKNMKNSEEVKEATDVEALIYLYTASLSMPLDDEWTEIYLWLTKKHLEKNKKELPDFLKEIGELDEYERELLNELKRWIYNAQQKHFNNKYKEFKIESKEVDEEQLKKQKLLTDFLRGNGK